uniref:CLP-POGL1 n=1 Tax=Pogona barbata TaxID=52202 RepID=Q2XXN7_POGBA|nr:CLP-POGL1 [Pogona barbata]
MRFLYLLFAVAFLFSVQAEDAELEQEQQGDPWEGLDEFQDQIPDDLGADDATVENRGSFLRGPGFDECSAKNGTCQIAFCRGGTRRIGKCNFLFRCCSRSNK